VFSSVLMIQDIKAPITTYLVYDHKKNVALPAKVIWEGREYKITKIGMHYRYRVGNTLMHVFTVATASISFKLVLNTDNLFWTVEQIADGIPD